MLSRSEAEDVSETNPLRELSMNVEPSDLLSGNFFTKLNSFPLKRLYFITVKDNTKNTKWMLIGKVNDWIKRYSKNYFIVRGTCGGDHYHLIAGLEPDKTPIPQKGIHFNIQDLTTKQEIPYTAEDYTEMREAKDKKEYYMSEKFDRLTLLLNYSEKKIITDITTMINKYWMLKNSREKRSKAKTKKESKVLRIVNYLFKNLNEPREHMVRQYTDYIIKHS